jgi:hypothetical protein
MKEADMNFWKLTSLVLAATLVLVLGFTTMRVVNAEPQPHMRAALVSLRAAKGQLEKASHDKGGHRVRAIGLIDQAIAEVEKGIAFDNAHHEGKKGRRH